MKSATVWSTLKCWFNGRTWKPTILAISSHPCCQETFLHDDATSPSMNCSASSGQRKWFTILVFLCFLDSPKLAMLVWRWNCKRCKLFVTGIPSFCTQTPTASAWPWDVFYGRFQGTELLRYLASKYLQKIQKYITIYHNIYAIDDVFFFVLEVLGQFTPKWQLGGE